MTFQSKLVMCCLMMHNFIRASQLYEDAFYNMYDNEQERYIREHEEQDQLNENELNYTELVRMRDRIAQDMYDAYRVELTRRGL